MAEIPASFIPQKEIRSRKKKSFFQINIFLLIAVIIFLTTVAASIGVFLWQGLAEQARDTNLAKVESSESELGIDEIVSYLSLSNRLKAVDVILDQHVDVTQIFDLLERYTLTEVVLSNFRFNTDSDRIRVSAEGTAPTYDFVAVQANVYGDQPIFKDLILSGVDQNREGTVSFSLEFSVLLSDLILR